MTKSLFAAVIALSLAAASMAQAHRTSAPSTPVPQTDFAKDLWKKISERGR